MLVPYALLHEPNETWPVLNDEITVAGILSDLLKKQSTSSIVASADDPKLIDRKRKFESVTFRQLPEMTRNQINIEDIALKAIGQTSELRGGHFRRVHSECLCCRAKLHADGTE